VGNTVRSSNALIWVLLGSGTRSTRCFFLTLARRAVSPGTLSRAPRLPAKNRSAQAASFKWGPCLFYSPRSTRLVLSEKFMALAAAPSFSKAKVGVLETGEVGEADDTGDRVVEILTAPSATVRATVGSSRNRSNFCAI
jgi:hypothetical protein